MALAMTVDEGSELLSASPFSTLKECIEDAKTHGYVVPAPETCVNTTEPLSLVFGSAKRTVKPSQHDSPRITAASKSRPASSYPPQ